MCHHASHQTCDRHHSCAPHTIIIPTYAVLLYYILVCVFTINVAKLYDADGNGTLDLDEFRTMLVNLDDLDPSNVAQFWVDALKVRAERSKEERREKERQR